MSNNSLQKSLITEAAKKANMLKIVNSVMEYLSDDEYALTEMTKEFIFKLDDHSDSFNNRWHAMQNRRRE